MFQLKRDTHFFKTNLIYSKKYSRIYQYKVTPSILQNYKLFLKTITYCYLSHICVISVHLLLLHGLQ